MNIAPARELKTGQVIEATLDIVERCVVPAAAFVVGLALANGAIAWFGLHYTSIAQQVAMGVAGFVVAVVAAYLLFDVMLRKLGFIQPDADDVIVPYALLSILYSLAVGLGFLLIIFPGLYLMARWSVAQPLLIAQGKGVIASMKESWERTRGSEFAILVAILVLVVLPGVISMFAGIQFEPDDPIGIAITQRVSSIASMAGIAMGVALYRLIVAERDASTARTFE
jgi:hypothetical protein